MRPALPRATAVAAFLGAVLSWTACTSEKADLPTAPQRLEDSLELAADPASIQADGISESRIVAKIISEEPDPSRLAVAFSTTAGTIVGATGSPHEVVADVSTKEAAILLRSSRQVETAAVTAQVKASGVAKTVTVDFVQGDPGSVIRFLDPPARGEADGASTHTLRVEVSTSVAAGSMVEFSTTQGAFLSDDTVPVDLAFQAQVQLQSPSTPSTALVRAVVTPANVPTSTEIVFTEAYPDVILVEAAGTVAAGASVEVTATFRRNPGRGLVNAGLATSFTATDGAGDPIGSFSDPPPLIDGDPRQAARNFFPGMTAYRGDVTITVGVPGSSRTGSVVVRVVDPA